MNHLSSAHLATRAAAVAALLAILIPGGAQASLTGTGEFKISVQTSGVATEPQVAMDDDGDSVVVWAADEAGASWGIFARRYDRDGLPQGAVIHVNITTAGLQIRPDVAVDADGDFVVVWQSRDQDGDGDGVYARVFDRLGNPLSGEILVNSHTAGNQTDPRVAVDGDGDFVVAWEGRGPIGMSPDVWVRRFSASGVPQGVEVRAPSSMSFHAGNPDVAMAPDGDFVVVFTRAAGGGGSDVFARLFSPFGPQGMEFTVNTFLQHTQGNPAVAMDDSGDFVVVWESFTQDGSDHGIYGQRFGAGGGKQGAEFQVHTFVEGIQIRPTVAIDADGDFVAAWQSPGPQGESSVVLAQCFLPNGTREGGEFLVNPGDFASFPAAAMTDAGEFLIVYKRGSHVYGQLYGLGVPPPPAGPWFQTAAIPGFRFKVRISGGAVQPHQEAACIADTLCVSGALPGRSEVFLRVIGPRPNGYFWPTLVKFTPSEIEVWIERLANGELEYYSLPAVGPSDEELPGLQDRFGFQASAAPAAQRALEPAPEWAAPPLVLIGAAAPAPPPGSWLESGAVPGFRFKVRINDGAAQSRKEDACIGETLCVSGALPGRSEIFLRVIGPRPNGYLWPTMVRFTPSKLEVWIEQHGSGALQYYLLPAIGPGDDELPGLQDRDGFLP